MAAAPDRKHRGTGGGALADVRLEGAPLRRIHTTPLWAAIVLAGASIVPGRVSPAATPAPGSPAPHPLQVRFAGTVELEADFHRPGETQSYNSEQSFYGGPGGRARMDWTTWREGDSTRVPESFLVLGDSVFHRDAPGARWMLLAGRRAHEGRLQALAGLPAELARRQKGAWRPEWVGEHARPDCYVESWAHPRLGDVRDSIGYTWKDGDAAPQLLRMVLHARDSQWRVTEHLAAWSGESPAESLFRSPGAFDPPSATPDSLVDEPRLIPLAPGLWSADMEDIGSRTLIVEFADYLVMIEFAVGSANGERLADAARRQWPRKPIRYALFSHYHPHYVGGVRAMIAEGATVVTTPLNEPLVRKMAALPFTIAPDRLARSPRPLQIRTFTDRFELADSTNRLVALNYGERSQHTDEFVVFWLPRAKLLFESSLGWYRAADGTLRASARAAPLLAWADEQKLDVARIVQSWPMRGNAAEQSRAELDSLVRAPRR